MGSGPVLLICRSGDLEDHFVLVGTNGGVEGYFSGMEVTNLFGPGKYCLSVFKNSQWAGGPVLSLGPGFYHFRRDGLRYELR
jgi:hypothetical protein